MYVCMYNMCIYAVVVMMFFFRYLMKIVIVENHQKVGSHIMYVTTAVTCNDDVCNSFCAQH